MFAGVGGRKYFVDLAANHPTDGSSTYELEKSGWNGLCIEPNPQYANLLRTQRKCRLSQAAIDSVERNVTFRFMGTMGGIEDERFDNRPSVSLHDAPPSTTLRTRLLADVLRSESAPRNIHYFSLDVEGAEDAVLPPWFPWDSYIFYTLSIERPPPALNARLFQHGYLFVQNFGVDTFYVHRTHPLASRFKALETNASFLQVPAKCKNLHAKNRAGLVYRDRVPLRTPCSSIFGCCAWPGYPPRTTRYGAV